LYFPILILLPKLIYLGNIDIRIFAVLILAGQVALFLYDRGYEYFQGSIWGKIRKKIKLD